MISNQNGKCNYIYSNSLCGLVKHKYIYIGACIEFTSVYWRLVLLKHFSETKNIRLRKYTSYFYAELIIN